MSLHTAILSGDRREALHRIVDLLKNSVNHVDGAEDCKW
jgi:hypothetical protein